MPLYGHAGAGLADIGVTGTVRLDISDLLLPSLVTENNWLGALEIGAEIASSIARWEEDSLNPVTVKDNTPGGLGAGTTTWVLNSVADAAVLKVGSILIDQTIGDMIGGEQIQVTAVAAGSTSVTISRAYGGTTAVTHANGNTFIKIGTPIPENSGLGADESKPRTPKSNVFMRFERNLNISSEAILVAKYGYAPGVPSEFKYQWEQRWRELAREMNVSSLYGLVSTASPASTGGDNSTMNGFVHWLDGNANATATSTNAAGALLSDQLINNANLTLVNNGGVPDQIWGGSNAVNNLSRMYNDRIRIVQDDTTRGFKVKEFDTTFQNTLRIMWDKQIGDAQGTGFVMLVDSGRVRLRPFVESALVAIFAPSFNDGDAARMLSKWTLDVRNTGSDTGQAHQLIRNLAF